MTGKGHLIFVILAGGQDPEAPSGVSVKWGRAVGATIVRASRAIPFATRVPRYWFLRCAQDDESSGAG